MTGSSSKCTGEEPRDAGLISSSATISTLANSTGCADYALRDRSSAYLGGQIVVRFRAEPIRHVRIEHSSRYTHSVLDISLSAQPRFGGVAINSLCGAWRIIRQRKLRQARPGFRVTDRVIGWRVRR